MKQTCRNCRFSRSFGGPDSERWKCRRHPPAFELYQMSDDRWDAAYLQPIVSPHDWCGEWQQEKSYEELKR
jgi:hypothetical protein